MSTSIETRLVAVISVSHMRLADAQFLENNNPPGLYFKNKFAYQLTDVILSQTEALSPEFLRILKSLFGKGFTRVELDQDGELLDGFATFEW